MIPTVEQILKDLLAGSITMEQAVKLLDQHLASAYDWGHRDAFQAIRAEEEPGF